MFDDFYRPFGQCIDYFSKAISNVISTFEKSSYFYGNLEISKKPFCKNGKHMRRRNYWKAVHMDSSIASRNKHLL